MCARPVWVNMIRCSSVFQTHEDTHTKLQFVKSQSTSTQGDWAPGINTLKILMIFLASNDNCLSSSPCIASSQSLFHYSPLLTMKRRLALSLASTFLCLRVLKSVCGCILYIQFYSYPPSAERACLCVITAWLSKALFASVCLPVCASFISAEN